VSGAPELPRSTTHPFQVLFEFEIQLWT